MKKITELGRYRANPYASQDNVLKLEKCVCNGQEVCLDTLVSDDQDGAVVTLDQVTYDGTVYTPASPILISDVAAIEAWLGGIFETKEFDVHVKAEFEVSGGNNGVLTIKHTGAGTLEAGVLSVGSFTVTRCCTVAAIIQYRSFAEGALPNLVYGGSNEAFPNSPYTYTGVAATDAATAETLKDDVEAMLTTLGVVYSKVHVIVSDADQGFYIDYYSADEDAVSFQTGAEFTVCDEQPGFIC